MGIVLDYSTRRPSWVRRHWRKLAALLLLALVATPIWWYWRPIERWARWQWTYRRVVAELRLHTSVETVGQDRRIQDGLIREWWAVDGMSQDLCAPFGACFPIYDPGMIAFADVLETSGGRRAFVVVSRQYEYASELGSCSTPMSLDMPSLFAARTTRISARRSTSDCTAMLVTPVGAVKRDSQTVEVSYGTLERDGPGLDGPPLAKVIYVLRDDLTFEPKLTWSDPSIEFTLAGH